MAADAPLFPAALAAAAHAGAAHAAALAAAPDALAAAPDDAPAEAAVNRSAKLKAKPKPKPKPKHAMFSCTFSDHHFELKRSPTTHAKLLHEFVAAGGDATMQPADHAHCVGRFKASTFVFAALAGCQSTRRWSAFFRDEAALEAMRWEVFAICLSTNDPVGLQFLWQGLRADCKEASGPTMPDDVRLELFKNNDPDDDTVVRMLQTAVCACCKPRLGLLLLQQQKRTLSLGARCDLFAMVVAIADAVFGADKTRKTSYIEDHGKWLQVLASAPKPTPECPCVPDKAIDLDAWKQLIRALLLAVGAHGVPNRVVEMLPRDRTYSLGALQVAVRYAEHDTFLLDELLAHKHWSSSALIEAYNEALDASQGVRGPKLCSVLKTLYVELLSEWRRRSPYSGWKSDARDLVFAWKTAVASARGYVEIDVDAHGSVLMASAAAAALWPNDEDESIDPAVWMEILAAMVAAHEPDEWDAHSKHWDHSSALFASLMCAALRACLGDSNKTHILSFLLACEKKTQHAAAMHSCWHDIPGIVSDVAEHHAEAFPMLIKAMLAVDARDARDARDALRPCSGNSRGSSTPVMLEANVAHLCNGFLYCVNGDLKEPARLIVRALAQHGQPLPKTLLDTVTAANKPTLEFWIEALGKGVSVAERARFGSNFANLVNLETEQDFREILASTPWTREELDGALAEAVRLQRAIPAQLLITLPPHECARLPDGVRNAWLEAITEYVFRPDGAGAQAVCARLMSDQAKLPLAAERNNKRNAGAAGLALPLSAPPPLRRVRSA